MYTHGTQSQTNSLEKCWKARFKRSQCCGRGNNTTVISQCPVPNPSGFSKKNTLTPMHFIQSLTRHKTNTLYTDKRLHEMISSMKGNKNPIHLSTTHSKEGGKVCCGIGQGECLACTHSVLQATYRSVSSHSSVMACLHTASICLHTHTHTRLSVTRRGHIHPERRGPASPEITMQTRGGVRVPHVHPTRTGSAIVWLCWFRLEAERVLEAQWTPDCSLLPVGTPEPDALTLTSACQSHRKTVHYPDCFIHASVRFTIHSPTMQL